MKNLIYLLYFIPTLLIGQAQQVSDINYQLPRDDYEKKGFIKIENDEYFIEQGIEGTKVSIIQGDSLEFIHTIKHRPTNSTLNPYAISFHNSNSGLIYKGSILYEIYWDYIYGVDIITGELVEQVNLKELNLRLQRDFYQGDNYYHFRALGIGWSGYVRLDKATGDITNLEENGFFVDDKRYWASADSQTLFFNDLEKDQIYIYPHSFSQINNIELNYSDSTTQLIIRDNTGLFQLKSNGTLLKINCPLQENDKPVYLSDTRLGYTNETEFKIIDLSDCSEVFSITLDHTSSMQVFTNNEIFNEYFIFGTPNDWEGDGVFYLYDIQKNKSTYINIPIDYPILYQAVRYDNYLYFLSSNHIHHFGWFPELYRLDLNDGMTSRISNYDIFTTSNIVIGEMQDDNKKLNIYYRVDSTASLNTSSVQSAQLSTVSNFDLFKNQGIHYSIYTDIWADGKYFFYTSDAIFCTVGNTTTKIINDVLHTSAFLEKGNHVFILSVLDSACYSIKINTNDLSFSKILIPGLTNVYYNKEATSENAIVNLHRFFNNTSSSGYFDVDLQQFITIESLGLPQGTPRFLSGNNILYYTKSQAGNEWYLIDTKTKQTTLTDIESGTFNDAFPDGEGGFYLDGLTYGNAVNFVYLDSSGKLTNIYKNFDYQLFYRGEKFDGDVKSLAFDGTDELVFLMTKDGQVKQKFIPDNGLLYYESFFWYKSDNISIVEVENGSTYDTYIFSFDADPKKITANGREERLLGVLEEEEFSILIYKDVNHKFIFEKYTYATDEFLVMNEMQSVRNNSIGSSAQKVNNHYHLLSIDDNIHGQEPYLFNTINGEFILVDDIRTGFASSNIDNITEDPQTFNIYFTAIGTEGDRQLFRLNDELLKIEVVNKDSKLGLIVYPNPATEHITTEENFKEIFIFGIDGKIVIHDVMQPNGQIKLTNIPSGVYFILGRTNDNYWESGKFCIQK